MVGIEKVKYADEIILDGDWDFHGLFNSQARQISRLVFARDKTFELFKKWDHFSS